MNGEQTSEEDISKLHNYADYEQEDLNQQASMNSDNDNHVEAGPRTLNDAIHSEIQGHEGPMTRRKSWFVPLFKHSEIVEQRGKKLKVRFADEEQIYMTTDNKPESYDV